MNPSSELPASSHVLTLEAVAAQPALVTSRHSLTNGTVVLLRPLLPGDAESLAAFLSGLSAQTRRFYTYPCYDLDTAREMCEAIARYDKLRLVAVVGAEIIGIFEFSLSILPSDIARYRSYGIELDCQTDIRFGPCLADAWQSQGLGSRLLPSVCDIARRSGKRRMILWGGVFAENTRAIRFYEKTGFRLCGRFQDQDGGACLDGYLNLG